MGIGVRAPLCLLPLLVTGCFSPAPGETIDTSGLTAVPLLSSPIMLDKVIDEEEWAGAWQMSAAFVIDDGSNVSGRYPFVLRVAGDETRLFVAIEIANVTQRFEQVPEGLASPAENIWFYVAEDQTSLLQARTS